MSPADRSPTPDTAPPLVLVGALHVDELFTPLDELVPRASNPVRVVRRPGGVAGNVARAARRALHGRGVSLVCALGDDPDGDWLVAALAADGVDCRAHRVRGRPSGRYGVVHDARGELYVGLADTAIAETLDATTASALLGDARPGALVLDANLAPDCLAALLEAPSPLPGGERLDGVPRVALAVSPAKATRLRRRLGALDLLFCNRREAAALTALDPGEPVDRLGEALAALGARRFVLSDGPAPVLVRDAEAWSRVPVPPCESVPVSVNGAGDALAGATLARWLSGADPEAAHPGTDGPGTVDLALAVREAGLPAARAVVFGER